MLFSIICIITFFINSILGFFVYRSNPKQQPNKEFALMAGSIVGWIVTLFIYYIVTANPFLTFIGRLNFAVGGFMAYYYFRFAYVFPDESIKIRKPILRFAAYFAYAVGLMTLFTPLVDSVEIAKGAERIVEFGVLYPFWNVYFLINLFLGTVIVFVKIRQLKGPVKIQLQYLLTGFLMFFIPIFTTNIILPYYFNNYDLQVFSPLTTIPLIAFTTYAIVKHRLMDIKRLTIRTVSYALVVIFVGSLFGSIAFYSGLYIINPEDTAGKILSLSLLALIFAFSFQPLEKFFSRLTNHIFYKYHYDGHELLYNIALIMALTPKLEELVQKILCQLTREMHIEKAALIIHHADKPKRIYTEGSWSDLRRYIDDFPYNRNEDLYMYYETTDVHIKKLMRITGANLIIQLRTGLTHTGLLLLGTKLSGDTFEEEDIRLLETLAPEIAVAIQNAYANDEIQKFNLTLQKEIERATSDLRAANEHLQELDRMKDEFVSIVSHELRTPISVIKGYLTIVLNREEGFSPKTKQRLQHTLRTTHRLLMLVNDMLDISRIENNRIKLVLEDISPNEILEDINGEFQQKAKERSVELKLTTEKLPLISIDKNKLHQIISNLVDNAIKFTPEEGSVTINGYTKDHRVYIDVSDTGIGIDDPDLPKLFTKFGRLDSSLSGVSQTPGTGLGLYISKKLVELCAGTIIATSKLHEGTTFSVSFPQLDK